MPWDAPSPSRFGKTGRKLAGDPPRHLGGGSQPTTDGPSSWEGLLGCACADPVPPGALSIPLGKVLSILPWLEQGLLSKPGVAGAFRAGGFRAAPMHRVMGTSTLGAPAALGVLTQGLHANGPFCH